MLPGKAEADAGKVRQRRPGWIALARKHFGQDQQRTKRTAEESIPFAERALQQIEVVGVGEQGMNTIEKNGPGAPAAEVVPRAADASRHSSTSASASR